MTTPACFWVETHGPRVVRALSARLVLLTLLFVPVAGCHRCGLAEHERLPVASGQTGAVPCCGGAVFQDVALSAETSDAEFSLANTEMPTQAGSVDAFLVPTSCGKLFDGPYPGSTPLCPILAGPAKPGGVSSRIKLSPGSYRVYLQGYSIVTEPAAYLVDVYTWDYRCRSPLQ